MFAQPTITAANEPRQIGSYEFIDCDCGTVFRVLLIDDRRHLEIARRHCCPTCRQRVIHYAEQTGHKLLIEV